MSDVDGRPLLRVFVGALLLQFVFGIFFSWGSFTVHITSYLRRHAPAGANITYEETAWVSAAGGLGVLLAYFGGMLHERIGLRGTSLLGGLVLSGGMASSAVTVQLGVLPFLVTYGLVFGMGMGIAYSAPVKCIMEWVPERNGTASSVVFAGVGLGTIFFNYLELWLVNPDGLQPVAAAGTTDLYFDDEAVLDRVPGALFRMGLMSALLSLLSACLLVERPLAPASSVPLLEAPSDGQTPSEVVRTRDFWLLWLSYCLGMQAASFLMAFVKVFGQNVVAGLSDNALTFVAASSALANAAGRVCFGSLLDVLQPRWVIVLMSAIMAVFSGTLGLCKYGGFAMYLVWISVIFFCVGGVCSIWGAVMMKYFGPAHFGRNFGLLLTAAAVAYVAGTLAIYCLRSIVGDAGDALVAAGASATAALCAFGLSSVRTTA